MADSKTSRILRNSSRPSMPNDCGWFIAITSLTPARRACRGLKAEGAALIIADARWSAHHDTAHRADHGLARALAGGRRARAGSGVRRHALAAAGDFGAPATARTRQSYAGA